jgi:RNA-directed DNA polymerase
VLEFDIKGLFDNIDHNLLMRAVRKHTDEKWVLLYIERWLKAPSQREDGTLTEREKGTPQGGVISPLLANLFLHYAFDVWMVKHHPDQRFARYADDAVVHCSTEACAVSLKGSLEKRFVECGLTLHPEKTKVVYCQDDDRRGDYPNRKFDFLGFTFRPRRSRSRAGKFFINFTPAVSNKAARDMRQKIRSYKFQIKSDQSLENLARMFNPVLRGWVNYYGSFYKSAMYPTFRHLDNKLIVWAVRKYKRFKRSHRQARRWLGRIARQQPFTFVHWQMGVVPSIE